MMRLLLLTISLLSTVLGHDLYGGKCPTFPPMAGFDWSRFSDGVWYVTNKFDTESSCLTYEFLVDNLGFKSIKQVRHLPLVRSTGLDHEYVYTGKLYAPQESTPAKMVVRFPLNALGSSSFVVLDSDYDTYGLICTCQDVSVPLDLFNFHRRSCSILQRDNVEDTEITSQMRTFLNTAMKDNDFDHDFDKIKQNDCEYGGDKLVTIDVDKILNGEPAQYDTSNYGDFEPDAEIIDPNEASGVGEWQADTYDVDVTQNLILDIN